MIDERRIIIGLVTSTEYIQKVEEKKLLDTRLFESPTAKRIADWCLEYYHKYKTAPGREIETICYVKIKDPKFPKDVAEEIVDDILPDLSSQYEREGMDNIPYLATETEKYFDDRAYIRLSEQLKGAIETGKRDEAKKLLSEFKEPTKEAGKWIDLADENIGQKVAEAFTQTREPIVVYPGALGQFLNKHLVRGGFIAFMGSEKRGKSFWLLDLLIRAARQKRKVAFFQAGDMTELDQLERIGVYLTRKNNLEEYSGRMYEPCADCIFNQLNTCEKKERTCDFGPFESKSDSFLRQEMTLDELREAWEENKDYIPCTDCEDYKTKPWGAVWYREVDTGEPLTTEEAVAAYEEFFVQHKRNFRVSTHISGSLSVDDAKIILDTWKKDDGFEPDVIGFDYPDIMREDRFKEVRHKQNQIWMDLRGLSQERDALVAALTQSDSDGYKKDLLSMSNFSEDKRKLGHVTAVVGLNQDHHGCEKDLKIMRLNFLVARRGSFNSSKVVHVLQNLERGRPFIDSYW